MRNSEQDPQENQYFDRSEEPIKTSEKPPRTPLQNDVESLLTSLLRGFTGLIEFTALSNYIDRTLEIRIKVGKSTKK